MRAGIKNPKLIIKNGFYLFVRLLLVMALAFYTTRLTLQILGDEDYGINNIIGGVISMFAIISMPITGALQRFFNVEFTKQVIPARVVFSSSLRIIFVLAIGMTVLYETVGLYLVNYVLKYPDTRSYAVNVIFQLTVLTTIFNFFSLSYSSLLFAKEDMGIPATIEIISAILKLLLLFSISYVSVDTLIAYAGVILLISVFQLLFYVIYCRTKYEEARWCRKKHTQLQKDIFKFAGWSSISAAAGISLTYLSNVFINIFGGVLYNTAYGLSSQLSNAVVSFSTNVMKAVDPQITSATVAEQNNYRDRVALASIKISLLGVGFFYVVFLFFGSKLLQFWLGHVPDYVEVFCRISLLNIMFTSVVLPLKTIIMATGQIRRFFLSYGIMAVVGNAVMYLLLWMGWPIITVMYIILIVTIGYFINAVITVDRLTTLKIGNVLGALIRSTASLIIVSLVFMLLRCFFTDSLVIMLMTILFGLVVFFFISYVVALDNIEKEYFKGIINNYR